LSAHEPLTLRRHRGCITVGYNNEEVNSADRTDRSIAPRQRRTRVRAWGPRRWRCARLRRAARWLRRPSRLRGASIRGSPRVPRPWLHRERATVLLGLGWGPILAGRVLRTLC